MKHLAAAAPDPATLEVHVQPGAKRTVIIGIHDNRLKVALAAPATDGRANAALIRFVAELAGVAPSNVEIVQGQSTRRKVLRIEGVGSDALNHKLAAHGILFQPRGKN